MTVVAEKIEKYEADNKTRRFEIADLSKHGKWLLPRLVQLTNLPEQTVAGWVKAFITMNGYMFLYQDHAVALVQAVPGYGLKPQLTIQEIFVWVEDRDNKEHVKQAADIYDHIARWAKLQGADKAIVAESTDVPQAMIEERLGRLFKFETRYARIK